MIHLIRHTFRYAARQDWDQIAWDIKPIYTAVNAEQAPLARSSGLSGTLWVGSA